MRGARPDRHGIRAYVKLGGVQIEKRFKRGTKPDDIKAWREDARRALRAKAKAAPPTDTLRADAKKYLAHQKPKLLSYKSRVCEIEAWLPEFGDTRRSEITRSMIQDVVHGWLTHADPKLRRSPKTCNHRVRALRHLYRYIDGSRAQTPCDDIARLQEPSADPKVVPVKTILRVARTLTDAKTRARFMVLASTGHRPAQLKRALPDDVSLSFKLWKVRRAKGGNPIPLALTKDMIAAWKTFIKADAWGNFDGSDYAKELYAAGWPKDVPPYNAKHTVALTLAESGAEWEDIKDFFGHTDVKTTRIYTGIVVKRMRDTAARLEGRLGWK